MDDVCRNLPRPGPNPYDHVLDYLDGVTVRGIADAAQRLGGALTNEAALREVGIKPHRIERARALVEAHGTAHGVYLTPHGFETRGAKLTREARVVRLTGEIDRHRVAMLNHQRPIDKMRVEAEGSCCPTCVYGRAFTEAVEHQKRCGATMSMLLRKRAASGDVELAAAIDREVWP